MALALGIACASDRRGDRRPWSRGSGGTARGPLIECRTSIRQGTAALTEASCCCLEGQSSVNSDCAQISERETTDAIQTATNVTTSGSPSTFGQSVTFTATVKSGNPAVNVVTAGQVKFGTGNNCVGDFSQLQAAQSVDASGQVTYATTSLAVGTTTIRACYLGFGTGAAALQISNGTVDQRVDAAGNAAPTAQANGPYSGNEGSAISLSSAGSNDSDGTIASYAWSYSITTADVGASCSFSNATAANPTITCNDDGSYTVKLKVTDDDGAESAEDTAALTVSNVAPTVTLDSGNTYTFNESSTAERSFNYSVTDPGSNDVSTMTTSCGTGGAKAAGNSDSLTSGNGTLKCIFQDGPATPTISAQAADDDNGTSVAATHLVTVNNVPPYVYKPAFQTNLIACRTSVDLTNISFTDPGVIDYPWNVNIGWGEGPDTNYNTNAQGAQTDQSHTYNSPGVFTATVQVTDKDNGMGSNTSSNTVEVYQYAVDFLPPFDDSSPGGLIVNKMKNGRVVPVKARVLDLCTQTYLTDASAEVTIRVSKTSGTGSGDPVEEYADAGQSSAGTDRFRSTEDFWIYNLDSTYLGLLVNNLYRVDVYVNGVKATIPDWAVLQPVK